MSAFDEFIKRCLEDTVNDGDTHLPDEPEDFEPSWPCGCSEYHTADCPRLHPEPEPDPDDFYDPEGYYGGWL